MVDLLLRSSTEPTSLDCALLVDSNYKAFSKESTCRFLQAFTENLSVLPEFHSIFARLMQSRTDPPLEIIWCYSSIALFGEISSENNDISSKISTVQHLLQHLSACSSSCSGIKSIALLAPVLFKFHQAVIQFMDENVSAKMVKTLTRKMENLIDKIISFIAICCSQSARFSSEDDDLVGLDCLKDLMRVWLNNRAAKSEVLSVFFPLVSARIRDGFHEDGCGVGYLAGVVVVEAFLMRLCLKIIEWRRGMEVGVSVSKPDMQKELRMWAVNAVTGFQNHEFFGMLLRLLLECTLPVSFLLTSEDEAFLREILYDVALVEFSFLKAETEDAQSHDRSKVLSLMRLFVSHKATKFARSNGDQTKAISYINAFSSSHLPLELIKHVTTKTGKENLSKPDVSTPKSFLKWLRKLDDQGLREIIDNISKLGTELELEDPDSVPSMFKCGSKMSDSDLFYVDKNGGDEEVGDELLAAAREMKFMADDERRKRKEEGRTDGKSQVKFLKHRLDDSPMKENLIPSEYFMNSESEVENPTSDEDVTEMEE